MIQIYISCYTQAGTYVHIYHVKILCEMYANALFTLKFM